MNSVALLATLSCAVFNGWSVVSEQRSRCAWGFPILGQVKAVLFSTGDKLSKADILILTYSVFTKEYSEYLNTVNKGGRRALGVINYNVDQATKYTLHTCILARKMGIYPFNVGILKPMTV